MLYQRDRYLSRFPEESATLETFRYLAKVKEQVHTKQKLESRSSDVAARVLTVYRYTHTYAQSHILIELGKWEGSNHQDIPEGDKKEERGITQCQGVNRWGLFSKRKKSDGLQMIRVGGWVGEGEDWHNRKSPTQVMENRKVESKPDFS